MKRSNTKVTEFQKKGEKRKRREAMMRETPALEFPKHDRLQAPQKQTNKKPGHAHRRHYAETPSLTWQRSQDTRARQRDTLERLSSLLLGTSNRIVLRGGSGRHLPINDLTDKAQHLFGPVDPLRRTYHKGTLDEPREDVRTRPLPEAPSVRANG